MARRLLARFWRRPCGVCEVAGYHLVRPSCPAFWHRRTLAYWRRTPTPCGCDPGSYMGLHALTCPLRRPDSEGFPKQSKASEVPTDGSLS